MGSGADKRNQAMAKRAYNLAQMGNTHRQIAHLIVKKPEQVKALILLGERLVNAEMTAAASTRAPGALTLKGNE